MMARLKIVRASGEVILPITPAVEYAFEKYCNNGIYKQMEMYGKESDIYWLAHNALQRTEVIDPFGEAFLETLISVEVLPNESPKK